MPPIGSARKRFIREAHGRRAVKNEHVVAIYGVENDAQPPYLVMEMHRRHLAARQDSTRTARSPSRKSCASACRSPKGLAAAHKQGLVHRDIKPANILLENGVERVKITDFGLARAVDDASVTQSGTVAGTPMYMSPEQAEGLPIDHRSDLFSLGTVLYAMCTGHPPFRASGTHAVLKRVIDASPRPIREINNEIPDWLVRHHRQAARQEAGGSLSDGEGSGGAARASIWPTCKPGEPSRVSGRLKRRGRVLRGPCPAWLAHRQADSIIPGFVLHRSREPGCRCLRLVGCHSGVSLCADARHGHGPYHYFRPLHGGQKRDANKPPRRSRTAPANAGGSPPASPQPGWIGPVLLGLIMTAGFAGATARR